MPHCPACGQPIPEVVAAVLVLVHLGAFLSIALAAWVLMWLWEGFASILRWPPMSYPMAFAVAWVIRWFTRPGQ